MHALLDVLGQLPYIRIETSPSGQGRALRLAKARAAHRQRLSRQARASFDSKPLTSTDWAACFWEMRTRMRNICPGERRLPRSAGVDRYGDDRRRRRSV